MESKRRDADRAVMLKTSMTVGLAIVTGVLLELGVHALSGRQEAWDSAQYWTMGLPAAALVSIAIGYLSKQSDWLWAFAIVPSQVLTMMVRNGDIGNLWPLAVILSSILSAPFVVASFIGSRFRPTRSAG
jgi:hypothetical protein